VDVGEVVVGALVALSEDEVQIYCSRISLLECLWVGSRLQERAELNGGLFASGIRSVTEGERYTSVEEDHRVFTEALCIREMGHEDMIDNLLFASSELLGMRLLTLDRELHGFVKKRDLTDTILFPDQLP
jgi:predicted nucleic acid-binding protein